MLPSWTFCGTFVTVAVAVGVAVSVGSGVLVAVGVELGVKVGVSVGKGVFVAVGRGVEVGGNVGVAVGCGGCKPLQPARTIARIAISTGAKKYREENLIISTILSFRVWRLLDGQILHRGAGQCNSSPADVYGASANGSASISRWIGSVTPAVFPAAHPA